MLSSSFIFIAAVTSTLAGPIQTPGAPVVFLEDALSNPGCAKPSGSPVVYPKEPVPDKDVHIPGSSVVYPKEPVPDKDVQIPGSSVVYPKDPVPDKDFQIPGSPVVYPKDQRGVESDFCTSCYDTNSVFCCNFFRRCCDVISPCPTGAKPDSSSPELPLCPDLQVCRPPGKC